MKAQANGLESSRKETDTDVCGCGAIEKQEGASKPDELGIEMFNAYERAVRQLGKDAAKLQPKSNLADR